MRSSKRSQKPPTFARSPARLSKLGEKFLPQELSSMFCVGGRKPIQKAFMSSLEMSKDKKRQCSTGRCGEKHQVSPLVFRNVDSRQATQWLSCLEPKCLSSPCSSARFSRAAYPFLYTRHSGWAGSRNMRFAKAASFETLRRAFSSHSRRSRASPG